MAARVGATGTVAGIDINPGMLAVARSVMPPGMSIEWYETSVEAIPLPDEAFDVVLCQLGLQFFPDKLAALREMRRVLAPGGRLVIKVVGPTPRIFVILAEALARHINPEIKAFVDLVFSLHDTGELQHLINGAGFREAAIHSDTRTLRLPTPKEFLWQYVQSTPLANAVVQVDDESRAALERDVVAKWQAFVEDGASLDAAAAHGSIMRTRYLGRDHAGDARRRARLMADVRRPRVDTCPFDWRSLP